MVYLKYISTGMELCNVDRVKCQPYLRSNMITIEAITKYLERMVSSILTTVLLL